jgi:hypothetical protein
MANETFGNGSVPEGELVKDSIDLYRKSLGRIAEIQMHILDAAAQQNAGTADLWRNIWQNVPGAEPWLDLAEQSIANLIEMRKQYLTFVCQQNTRTAESTRTPKV